MSGCNYDYNVQYLITQDDTWEEDTQIAQDVIHSSLWVEKVNMFLELHSERSSSQSDSMEYLITLKDTWEEQDKFFSNPENLEFLNVWKLKKSNSTSCDNIQTNGLKFLERSAQYKCKTYSEMFASRSELVTHNKICTKKSFECETCGKYYKSKSYLDNFHSKIHSSEKPYQCQACGKSYKLKRALVRHMNIHNERQHKCIICEETFTFTHSSEIKIHMRSHYNCDVCEKTFTTSGRMEKHMRTHNSEKSYNCAVCKKTFSTSYSLKSHMTCHSTERPYKCDICQKTFKWDCLKNHMRSHSNEKPYKCELCGKSFKHNRHLRRHQSVHTNEKPYNCTVCEKSFTRNDSLRQHMTTHTGERPYQCMVCETAFRRKDDLQVHLKTLKHLENINKV